MKPYRVNVTKSGAHDCKSVSVHLAFESESHLAFESESHYRYADVWIDKMWYFDKYKEVVTVYLGGDNVSEEGNMSVIRTEDYKSAKSLVYAFLNVV